jgi:hypothetical protein
VSVPNFVQLRSVAAGRKGGASVYQDSIDFVSDLLCSAVCKPTTKHSS